jgi:hypothetical protein
MAIPATNDPQASMQAIQMMLSGMSLQERQAIMAHSAQWGTEETRRAYSSLQSLAGNESSSQETDSYHFNQAVNHPCHSAMVDDAEAENFW